MSDAIENEIYQELYGIRNTVQSMNVRSELSAIRDELSKINAHLEALTRAAGVVPEASKGSGNAKSKGVFGFLR